MNPMMIHVIVVIGEDFFLPSIKRFRLPFSLPSGPLGEKPSLAVVSAIGGFMFVGAILVHAARVSVVVQIRMQNLVL